MIKNNKWKLIISSIIILLPIVFGLVFWDELPERMATHWGFDGKVDGWSNRYFSVFALPIIILVIHWLCILCTLIDPKNKNQNSKVFSIVIWITPIISLVANGVIYAVSFGKEFDPYIITSILMGLMFVVIGNYLPKCKQNYTIGIKVKWTLGNEENWNATHRIGGRIWVVGGLLLMMSMFLPNFIALWVMFVSIIVLVSIPVIYSYRYYRKQLKEGSIANIPTSKSNKIIYIVSLFGVIATLIFVWIIMFTGDIEVKYGEESLTIEASYWSDLTIEYDAINNIEYRDNDNKGLRTNGFGSARLLAGAFRNEEFGNYTRYSYTKCNACVVLNVEGKILVISDLDIERTKVIYENIKANI